jgi:hypothetical protein
MPRAQIKDEKTYQELRARGQSKEKIGADRERLCPQFAPCRRIEGRQEPRLHRLEQAGPAQAGQGDRYQGPFLDEQEAAD